MGMFETYDKLNPEYIPDNTSPEPSVEFLTTNILLPAPYKDKDGRLIGYTWNEGECFTFKLSANNEINVRNDSIVFNNSGEEPDNLTVGIRVGQQAYNTVDAKSWTYVGRTENLYMWVEDNELTYPTDGDITIVIRSDMTDKYAQLDIYNYRWEHLFTRKSDIGESEVSFDINEETSKTLRSGIYYCTLKIIGQEECILKQKLILAIQ